MSNSENGHGKALRGSVRKEQETVENEWRRPTVNQFSQISVT